MNRLIERAIQSIDIKAITKDVMSTLVITNLDMYFVVHKFDGEDDYDFVGMAYSEASAKSLARQNNSRIPCKIFRFDMGKLVALVENMGAAEEINVG